MNIDHDDDHPLPVVVDVFIIGHLSLCGARSMTAVGWQQGSGRQQGGRTVVDRDKRDDATHCNNDDNLPYPNVADIVIIWRLCLCSNGMTMAAVGQQQGGKDRGSGCHSLAMVGRGS